MVRYEIGLEDKKEKLVKVFTEMNHDGEVEIRCMDERGRKWWIARLTKNGTLAVYPGLGRDIGLKVDERGRIIVEEEV